MCKGRPLDPLGKKEKKMHGTYSPSSRNLLSGGQICDLEGGRSQKASLKGTSACSGEPQVPEDRPKQLWERQGVADWECWAQMWGRVQGIRGGGGAKPRHL